MGRSCDPPLEVVCSRTSPRAASVALQRGRGSIFLQKAIDFAQGDKMCPEDTAAPEGSRLDKPADCPVGHAKGPGGFVDREGFTGLLGLALFVHNEPNLA